jgi:hypothetical protein
MFRGLRNDRFILKIKGDIMRKIKTAVLFLAAFALLALSACGGDSSGPAVSSSFSTPSGTGHLRKSDTLWILNLEGSYKDMGRQYGALLKEELQTLFTEMDAAIGFNQPGTQYLIKLLENEKVMDGRERQLLEGMSGETGLSFDQHEFLNATLFFMYDAGCSAFSATGSQTEFGHTISGRNFDNPKGVFSTILRGKSILVIYNPKEQFTGISQHRDNSVAAMTQIGWIYGLTNLNSKGIYIEYNNGTNSIPIPPKDLTNPDNPDNLFYILRTVRDGLHQNLYAAFDGDSLEEVDAMLAGKAAIATITQIADKDNVWHYERSPYENSRKILAGEAGPNPGIDAKWVFYYDNPADMDIFTNHFFYKDWSKQTNNDPEKFNREHDSGSRSIARLINIQTLAAQAGKINPEKMKTIMTTHLLNDGTGGPFIGWELANPDVTHFTSVTDIEKKVMHIYPNVDSILYVDTHPVQWAEIDLNKEFR